jgi:ketosteroid isomerase-like protein
MSLVREAARRWAQTWERCWTAFDPEPIVALYADSAVWRSTSFREPQIGREGARRYVEQAFADESDVELCRFAEPVVDGDTASVEWWCVLQEEGRLATFGGTSVLRFGADGLVVEQRDYWFLEDGRHEPPPEWGR